MYPQKLSDYLGISSDNNFSFLDGVITSSVVKDRVVYLYPDYLSRKIEGFDSTEARSTIVSFFSKVTDIANDSNISEYEKSNKLGKLFDHIQEISSLSLGQAKNNNKGYGPKYEALLDFAYIVSYFSDKSLIEEEGMYVKAAELLVDNFGPDSLSDLIASLIYPQLIGYTKFVFDEYNISYDEINVKPVNGKQRFVKEL